MKLDHIVYFTKFNPARIVEQQQRLNRHAVVGGSHLKWGTQNALFYTSNAYIEWLSVENKEVAMQSRHPLTTLLLHDLHYGGGWGTICLSVRNIHAFDDEVKSCGYRTSGIIDGQRTTPAGKLRKWKMLFLEQSNPEELPFPFFIEWEEEDQRRLEELRREGIMLASNEATMVRKCIFRTTDPAKTASAWSQLLAAKIIGDNQVSLQNAVLQFDALDGIKRERLSDVIFETSSSPYV